jgi:hypothetical protein
MGRRTNGLVALIGAGILAGAFFGRGVIDNNRSSVELNNIVEMGAPNKTDYSYLSVYDTQIESALNYFEKRHKRRPETNLIKAMIHVESGSSRKTNEAFRFDPMQIANEGDYALTVLQNGQEHTKMIGDFLELKGKKLTPRKDGEWDYSGSNMTHEASINGGIGWLIHKAAIRDYRNGKLVISGWRDWKKAVERYNGGGDKDYVSKVYAAKKELDARD